MKRSHLVLPLAVVLAIVLTLAPSVVHAEATEQHKIVGPATSIYPEAAIDRLSTIVSDLYEYADYLEELARELNDIGHWIVLGYIANDLREAANIIERGASWGVVSEDIYELEALVEDISIFAEYAPDIAVSAINTTVSEIHEAIAIMNSLAAPKILIKGTVVAMTEQGALVYGKAYYIAPAYSNTLTSRVQLYPSNMHYVVLANQTYLPLGAEVTVLGITGGTMYIDVLGSPVVIVNPTSISVTP